MDSWIEVNQSISLEKGHALAVIVTNWGGADYWSWEILGQVSQIGTQRARVLSLGMNFDQRWRKIKYFTQLNFKENGLVEEVAYASKLFKICQQNRNAVCHVMFVGGQNEERDGLEMRTTIGNYTHGQKFNQKLEDYRRVADEIRILNTYLEQLCQCIEVCANTSEIDFPKRPDIPKALLHGEVIDYLNITIGN